MAFKMNGFPKHSGVGGVKAEEDLKKEMKEGSNIKDQKTLSEGKLLKSEDPDTYVYGEGKDSDDLQERIEFIKETANNEGRALTRTERADIKSIQERIKNL